MERYGGLVRAEIMERFAVIRECKKGDGEEGKSICLYSKSTGKLLGRHKNKADAHKQEAAIKAHGG